MGALPLLVQAPGSSSQPLRAAPPHPAAPTSGRDVFLKFTAGRANLRNDPWSKCVGVGTYISHLPRRGAHGGSQSREDKLNSSRRAGVCVCVCDVTSYLGGEPLGALAAIDL